MAGNWLTETELPQLVLVTLAASDTSDVQNTLETDRRKPRLLQRTIWMHFPGQPHLGQTLSDVTENRIRRESKPCSVSRVQLEKPAQHWSSSCGL
jgi:hypothetical protein